MKLNQAAPDFTLPDKNGKMHTLSDYAGKWVLLYFYPKDDTPGCTQEACGFRDTYASFKQGGVVVLGVSIDSMQRHSQFVKKFKLPFTLLADEQKKVVKLYHVWGKKKFMGHEYLGTFRHSFLIIPKALINCTNS